MGSDLRALVIDDSRAMRTIIGNILRSIGMEVDEALDGSDGLERMRRAPAPDLVLVDWNMPRMSGYDFLKAVRSRPEFERVQLVMVTSETEPSQIVRALGAGADEYILKPFTREALIEKLALIGVRV